MDLKLLFADKALKPKEKIETLCGKLIAGEITFSGVIEFAREAKDPVKASCIESFEFVSKEQPEKCSIEAIEFAVKNLGAKAPRIKWESAKVIGNLAAKYPDIAINALPALIANSDFDGTVVRWAAAYAIGEIIKLQLPINASLLPQVNSIIEREEKDSIKKIYKQALKKIGAK